MRRICVLTEPQMYSVRLEKQQIEKFRRGIESQPYLSGQDFFNYVLELFNNNVIQIKRKDFFIDENMLQRFQNY